MARLHRTALMVAALVIISAASQVVRADTYPSRPVKLIVPWSPGGGTDIFARVIADKLSHSMGQPFIVENRPGASGNIGASFVAKSAPDGHAIVLATITLATNPALYRELDFDAIRDFAPITLVAGVPHLLVVNPHVPAKSVKELMGLAKQRPGKLTYASAGIGSPFHIAAEFFKQNAGVDILHVPYNGGAPAVTDVVSGQVDMAFANLVAVLPFVKSEQLRALAVTTAKRSPAAPDIPTMQEAGLPYYEFTSWFGILAPAQTPREVIARLNKEIGKTLNSPEMQKQLSEQGADLIASTPQQFSDFLKSETRSGRSCSVGGHPTELTA
jgi:tripartite-type tricarboxylate transporter receptor subunit TctC